MAVDITKNSLDSSEKFDSVLTYLCALSLNLSASELLAIKPVLHHLCTIRRTADSAAMTDKVVYLAC
jgi:hypothetical protein